LADLLWLEVIEVAENVFLGTEVAFDTCRRFGREAEIVEVDLELIRRS